MKNSSDNPATVYELLLRSADRFGNETALTYLKDASLELIDEKISYSELIKNINKMVRLIHDHAKCNGSKAPVVSFLLPNIPQAYYILLGAGTAGIANPLNPLLSENALLALTEKAQTDILIALGPNPVSDIWQKAQSVAQKMSNTPKLIPVVFSSEGIGESFESMLADYSHAPLPKEWLPSPDSITAYFHTGGTTGTPKLAMHSHANHLCTANAYLRTMQAGVGDVAMNGLPLFHVAGALIVGLGSLAVGVNTVLPTMAGFRNPQVVSRYWDLVEHYQVTIGGAIPTTVAAIADVLVGNANISSLRYLMTGGAPLPLSVPEKIKEATGLSLYQIYGMTETSGVTAMPNLNMDPVPGSAGQVSGDIEVRIDSDSDIPEDVGEICVRGPMVFLGYLGTEEPPLDDDGWLRTGDLGYIDSNKNLFITGRAKDLIIRSGHNIDPAVIETCLESHPAVSMAAAVGKPDVYAGELPVAYVQLHPDQNVSGSTLRDYALAHIDERPACPKQVIVIEALPLTAVGKIHKPTLRARSAKEAVEEALAVFSATAKAQMLANGSIQVKVSAIRSDSEFNAACVYLANQLNLEIEAVEGALA
ncbi:MAG: AMP-binding protein [Bermanella sp.]